MELRKATRQKAKIRLGLSAVSGGGKTISSLLIAYGMTNDWDKIYLIDSENGRGELYANDQRFNIGEFNYLRLEAPYSPESYIKAIKMCEDAGAEVIIVDSITHEWSGKGGVLEIHGAMTGNSFTNWSTVTPRHQKFIDSLLSSKCHIITTVRRKTEYEMSKDQNGKMVIEKGGLKEVTRDDFEYELTVNLQLDINHNAKASKDNTGLFQDLPDFVVTVETGKQILAWCESGIAPIVRDVVKELKGAKNLIDLQAIFTFLNPEEKITHNDLKDKMKVKLTPASDGK